MQEIFYGAAIQGASNREERAAINEFAISIIKSEGFSVTSEHTQGKNRLETARFFEDAFGKVPPGIERSVYIRRTLLQLIDSQIVAAIFEASVPSLGTGIEIDRVCTRKDRGFLAIPLLILYQKDYWTSGLSTMVKGISPEEVPDFYLSEYTEKISLAQSIKDFLQNLK